MPYVLGRSAGFDDDLLPARPPPQRADHRETGGVRLAGLSRETVLHVQRTSGNSAATTLIQREIDDSSITGGLRRTGVGPRRGVPDWAKQVFVESGGWTTIMASMTPDGLIGSLYYADTGRIRTIHGAGPAEESDGDDVVRLRYHISDGTSMIAFLAEVYGVDADDAAHAQELIGTNGLWEDLDWWVARKLKDPTKLPPWAKQLHTAEAAIDLGETKPDDVGDTLLFELTKDAVDGSLRSKHPSRGFAVKFGLSEAALTEIKAILQEIDENDEITTVEQKNSYFYAQIERRLPTLKHQLRHPNQV